MNDNVKELNRVIAACKDAEGDFRLGADQARGAPLRQLLERRAAAHAAAAAELQALVGANGGDAQDHGSAAAAVQRGWQSVKASVAGQTDAALLEAAEQVERETVEHYAAALRSAIGSEARVLLERQRQATLHSQALMQMQIQQGKK